MSMAVAFADSGKVKNVGGYTSTDYAVPQKDASNAHQVKLIVGCPPPATVTLVVFRVVPSKTERHTMSFL